MNETLYFLPVIEMLADAALWSLFMRSGSSV